MEIKEIELRNFGPYRETGATFHSDSGNHIHIIEGPQGSGKTNLLMALKWCLYGGKGPTTNYKERYNEDARSEEEKKMHVFMKFSEGGDIYQVKRKISRFNHNSKQAREGLTLIGPNDRFKDDDAQDKINEILPEQLQDFFFLDGEEIRELVGEESGKKVKEEIETVLKHKSLINAQSDLDDVLSDELKKKRQEIEEEKAEREGIRDELEEKRQEKQDWKEQLETKREELETLKEDIESTRNNLEELQQEKMEDLSEIEEELVSLKKDKGDIIDELRDSWQGLHKLILADKIEEVKHEINQEIQEKGEDLDRLKEHQYIYDLKEEAKEVGECPVCGNSVKEIESEEFDDAGGREEELETKRTQLRSMKDSLDIPSDISLPSEFIVQLEDMNEDIREREEEKDAIMNELNENAEGLPDESGEEQLEENLDNLEDRKRNLERDIDDLKENVDAIKSDIQSLREERLEKAGSKEMEEINKKIEIVEEAINKIHTVRNRHVNRKRGQIKEKMNEVFDEVSRSEFMRTKYDGIEFKGEAGEETSYVLQLVKTGGKKKKMEQHTPSAGEAQLTALSFIFGLNKYAKYSTTIVFDTVAGRLDLDNSKGQGQFFSEMDEPLILLVTDAELENMGRLVVDNAATHYRIEMDDDRNSVLEEVSV